MAKEYNGLLKVSDSKDWKKLFTKKELEELDKITATHMKKNAKVEIKDTEPYLVGLKNNSTVVHIDTGNWDDTCGILPKRIKSFLNKINIKYLSTALDKTQIEFLELNSKADYTEYSEDQAHTFYDFDKFWKTKAFTEKDLSDYLKDSKKRILEEEKKAKLLEVKTEIRKIRYGKEYFEELEEKDQEKIISEYFAKGLISKELLFHSRKELWEKTQNFIPNTDEMLIIDPKFWNRVVFLKSLEKHHKTKQFASLSVKDRENFIDLYLTFGNNLFDIPFHLLRESKLDFFFNSLELNENGTNKAFLKLVRAMSRGVIPDITLGNLALFNYVLSINKKVCEKFLKQSNIFIKDLDSILSIGIYADKLKSSGYLKLLPYLMNLTKNSLDNIFRLDYLSILDLFNNVKENEQELPTAKFSVNDYDFEVIDKSDIRGFICGYPFSCQYIGGAGAVFTKYGYNNKDSSFMIVSKKGVIVAQSWIWKKDNQITFDSIEWKGGLSKESIKSGYEKYTDILFKAYKDLEIVTVGNCQSIFTSTISKPTLLLNTAAGHCYDSEKQFLVKKIKKEKE